MRNIVVTQELAHVIGSKPPRARPGRGNQRKLDPLLFAVRGLRAAQLLLQSADDEFLDRKPLQPGGPFGLVVQGVWKFERCSHFALRMSLVSLPIPIIPRELPVI